MVQNVIKMLREQTGKGNATTVAGSGSGRNGEVGDVVRRML